MVVVRSRRPVIFCLVWILASSLGSLTLQRRHECGPGPFSTPEAAAQFETVMRTDEIFLLAPRSLQRLLSEGKRAIEEGRYAEGIAALGGILYEQDESIAEDLRGQDFFLVRPSRGVYTQSVKNQAIEELNQLPEEGRKVLELQFGVTARQLLDQAIAQRDLEAIGDVARRFAHCEAGFDALAIVAQAKLSDGYPLVAADILQSLLDFPGARQRFGMPLAYAAAMAWQRAGKPDRALSTLQLAVRDFPGQSITLQGRQIPIENSAEILAAASGADEPVLSNLTADNWLTSGGNTSRNAVSMVGSPLPNERWEWLIHSSRPEGMALLDMEDSLRKNSNYLLPKHELRMLERTVMCRSNDSSLVGIDFETGLLVWRTPAHGGVAPLKRMAWDNTDKALSDELLSRVWGSTSFGRFTCDSQRCYQVVYSKDEAEAVRGMVLESSSRLEGISIARQGAILWRIGGPDGDEPQLSSAYFLGPPLPYGGQLYALVEINAQVDLVVLDPSTGKLQWRQQIATSPLLPVKSDPSRQAQALTPSISDGVILCPTGVGGIVAIDLLTRSFRWGAISPLAGMGRSGMNFPGGVFGSVDYDPLQNRWLDVGLIVDQGIVVTTPPESDMLACFDLFTGEQLYSRKRGDACYVAGLQDLNLILVHANRLQSIDLKNKRSRWEVQFPDGLSLAGTGIWQKDSLMLPLTNRNLIQVDLKQGSIAYQLQLAKPLGNLFAHQGQLLSVGPTSITCYHTRDELQERVDQKLATDPQDTWGLNYRSQLLLSESRYLESLELLLNAFEANPADDDTRFFLADTMLAGLQHDFESFSRYSDRLDQVIRATPQQWLPYLQLLAQGKLRQADYMGAFQRLWEMMRERMSAYVAGAMFRPTTVQVADDYSVDLDHWIAVEMGRCFQKCSADDQLLIQTLVRAELAKYEGTILPVRRQLARYLGELQAVEKQTLQLASTLIDRGDQLAAEQILQGLAFGSDNGNRDQALRLLQREHPLDKGLARPVTDSTDQLGWNSGLVVPQGANEAIWSVGRPTETISQRFGRPPVSIAVSDRSLILTDVSGKPVYNLAFRQATSDLTGTFMRSEMRGGLILLETVSELVAFDFYQGFNRDSSQSMLWRYSFDSISPQEAFRPVHAAFSVDELLGIQTHRRKAEGRQYAAVGPLLSGVKILQTGGAVVGLDAYTGRRLWVREGYSDQCRFAGNSDGNTLAVVDPVNGLNHLLDSRDGHLIRTSKFAVEEIQARLQNADMDKWSHWLAFDEWMVDYRADESKQVLLRVWSPLKEQILMEVSLSKEARVAKTNDGLMAALDPSGTLYLADLSNARVYQQAVAVEPRGKNRLSGIHLIRFADRAVIACNGSANALRLGQSPSDVLVNGHVYCFDLQTEQLAWSTPGRLTNMSIPLLQPRNSPFMAAYQPVGGRAGITSTSLILIDLRDGRLASLVEGLSPVEVSTFSMRLFPELQQIAVAVGEENFRFHVTDQPRPPEPVVHYGSLPKRSPEVIRDESSLFK